MKQKLLYGALFCLLALIVPQYSYAAVVWDYSPDTTKAAVSAHWYTNQAPEQHLAEKFVLSDSTTLQGMDIYSAIEAGFVGQTVTVQIWSDDSGEPEDLLHKFEETISTIDSEGTYSQNSLSRKFAEFSNMVTLPAGIYWIGMSSAVSGSGLGQATLDSVDDNHVAFFNADTFATVAPRGDMAFRLHEPSVAFRGLQYSVTSFDFGEKISGVDFDPTSGHLFMVDDRDAFDKTDIVYETDISGTVISSIPVPGAPYRYLRGLSVDGDIITLVTNGAILQMNKDGSDFIEHPAPDSSFSDYSGITYAPASMEYYVSRTGRGIYLADSSFNPTALIDTPALGYKAPSGLDYDPQTNTLLIVDDSPDDLFEMDLVGNVLDSVWLLDSKFPSRLQYLTSVAIDPATGTLYLSGKLYDDPFKIVVMRPIKNTVDPSVQIAAIEDFFKDGTATGDLVGTSRSSRINRVYLRLTESMLNAVSWFISQDTPRFDRLACRRIAYLIQRVDGQYSNWRNRDWVSGDAAPTLHDMLQNLEETLDCN